MFDVNQRLAPDLRDGKFDNSFLFGIQPKGTSQEIDSGSEEQRTGSGKVASPLWNYGQIYEKLKSHKSKASWGIKKSLIKKCCDPIE